MCDDEATPQEIEALRDEQQRTLDFSLVAAHLVVNLITEISRTLITPLADLDLNVLDDDEKTIVLEESQKTARRLRDTIRFALQTHADIEMAAGLTENNDG